MIRVGIIWWWKRVAFLKYVKDLGAYSPDLELLGSLIRSAFFKVVSGQSLVYLSESIETGESIPAV